MDLTATAANASGVNDGAAAMIVASETAAIDGQNGAGHPGGGIAGQEQRRIGDILLCGDVAKRRLTRQCGQRVVRGRTSGHVACCNTRQQSIGRDRTGCQGVHPDATAAKVQFGDPAPWRNDPRIGHQHIQRAQRSGKAGQFRRGIVLGQIDLAHATVVRDGPAVGRQIDDGDGGARVRQTLRDAKTKAVRTTGDHRRSALKRFPVFQNHGLVLAAGFHNCTTRTFVRYMNLCKSNHPCLSVLSSLAPDP